MINGIPVRIKTPNENGELANLETFMFATFRKCPELAKYPREIAFLENKVKIIKRKIEIAEKNLDEAEDNARIDEAGANLEKLNFDMIEKNEKMLDTFAAFVRTGLKAAGYPDDQIERYASYVSMDRFSELFGKSRLGAGVCDFF